VRTLSKKYILFFGGCFFFTAMYVWAQQTDQPIQYNHKIHIEDAGLECIDCHSNVGFNSRATIPNIEMCADCHDDTESDNEEQRKVAEYVNNGIKIPWVQVHSIPDYAYFSHRRHVVLGQIECESCHGKVAEMEKPFTKPMQLLKMDWCLDCHEQHQVNSDCYSCHR